MPDEKTVVTKDEAAEVKNCSRCKVQPELYVNVSEEYYRCPVCLKRADTLEEWDSIN